MRHLEHGHLENAHFPPLVFFFFFAVRRPLTVVASPVAEHRLRTRRLSGHGSWAQPLHGMWDLPGPGHEPVSLASAGGLSTTAPPGKPSVVIFILLIFIYFYNHSSIFSVVIEGFTFNLKWVSAVSL